MSAKQTQGPESSETPVGLPDKPWWRSCLSWLSHFFLISPDTPWWRRCLWHLFVTVGLWLFFIISIWSLNHVWTVPILGAVVWINIPIGITGYRSFRDISFHWDWYLITLLCLYANVIILLLITSTWLPDIHYLRGLWYGFLFVSGVLAIGFIGRLIKRDISISVMVYYLLGWVSTVLVHVLTQVQWSQEVQSVL